jgi:hypothetical protein
LLFGFLEQTTLALLTERVNQIYEGLWAHGTPPMAAASLFRSAGQCLLEQSVIAPDESGRPGPPRAPAAD